VRVVPIYHISQNLAAALPCFIRLESPPDRKVCPSEKRASVREGSNFYRTSAVTSILSDYTAGNFIFAMWELMRTDITGKSLWIKISYNGQCMFAVPGSSRAVPLNHAYRSERTDKVSPKLNQSHFIQTQFAG
jgi:hypothetical protein